MEGVNQGRGVGASPRVDAELLAIDVEEAIEHLRIAQRGNVDSVARSVSDLQRYARVPAGELRKVEPSARSTRCTAERAARTERPSCCRPSAPPAWQRTSRRRDRDQSSAGSPVPTISGRCRGLGMDAAWAVVGYDDGPHSAAGQLLGKDGNTDREVVTCIRINFHRKGKRVGTHPLVEQHLGEARLANARNADQPNRGARLAKPLLNRVDRLHGTVRNAADLKPVIAPRDVRLHGTARHRPVAMRSPSSRNRAGPRARGPRQSAGSSSVRCCRHHRSEARSGRRRQHRTSPPPIACIRSSSLNPAGSSVEKMT